MEDHSAAFAKFLSTHDTDLVRQYFTNTVLTPTETAHIIAKANLAAAKKPSQQRTSVSPFRNPTSSNIGKSTPTRSVKSKNRFTSISQGSFVATPTRERFPAEISKMQEMQANTDHLFNELRKANEQKLEF